MSHTLPIATGAGHVASGISPADIKEFGKDLDFINLGDQEGFIAVDSKSLKGDAKLAFKRLDDTWAGYPPQAFEAKVKGQPTTWIVENTDGGGYVYAFDAHGTLKASGSAGESSGFRWDGRASLPDLPSKD